MVDNFSLALFLFIFKNYWLIHYTHFIRYDSIKKIKSMPLNLTKKKKLECLGTRPSTLKFAYYMHLFCNLLFETWLKSVSFFFFCILLWFVIIKIITICFLKCFRVIIYFIASHFYFTHKNDKLIRHILWCVLFFFCIHFRLVEKYMSGVWFLNHGYLYGSRYNT